MKNRFFFILLTALIFTGFCGVVQARPFDPSEYAYNPCIFKGDCPEVVVPTPEPTPEPTDSPEPTEEPEINLQGNDPGNQADDNLSDDSDSVDLYSDFEGGCNLNMLGGTSSQFTVWFWFGLFLVFPILRRLKDR